MNSINLSDNKYKENESKMKRIYVNFRWCGILNLKKLIFPLPVTDSSKHIHYGKIGGDKAENDHGDQSDVHIFTSLMTFHKSLIID